jgi:hypothetical protein
MFEYFQVFKLQIIDDVDLLLKLLSEGRNLIRHEEEIAD